MPVRAVAVEVDAGAAKPPSLCRTPELLMDVFHKIMHLFHSHIPFAPLRSTLNSSIQFNCSERQHLK